MAGMFASGSAWFCLIVGGALLVEAAVFFVLRRRPGSGRRGPRGGQLQMLLSMGVMLVSGSVARLGGLAGAEMTAAFVVGAVGAVATLVFAIRSLGAQRRAAPALRKGTR